MLLEEPQRPLGQVIHDCRVAQRGHSKPKGRSPNGGLEPVANPYEADKLPPELGEPKIPGDPVSVVTIHDIVDRVREAQRGVTLPKGHPDNPKKRKRQ